MTRPSSRQSAASPAPLIWDLPLRLFHWTLVLLVIGSLVAVQLGGNWLEWHFRAGYAILTLMLFRLCWGFVGGRYARFRQFVYGPRQVLAYLRGTPDPAARAGHNPLGALSVWAMLFVITVQALLGLFANDDIASQGPLASLVSKDTSDFLTGLHHRHKPVLVVLFALHIAAIFWYRLFRGRNLTATMITGRDPQAPANTPSSRDDSRLRLRGLLILLVAAGVVWLVVNRLA